MKRLFTTKKKAVAAAIAAGAIVAGGIGAYAYWTTTGTGTGTAPVGTNVAVTVTGTASTQLVPGGSATVQFTVANSASFPQQISTISMTGVTAYDTLAHAQAGGATGLISGCGGGNTKAATTTTGDDFWMADVSVSPLSDGHIAAGATAQALTSTGTINMNDLLGQNQDACKSRFLRMTFTVS